MAARPAGTATLAAPEPSVDGVAVAEVPVRVPDCEASLSVVGVEVPVTVALTRDMVAVMVAANVLELDG